MTGSQNITSEYVNLSIQIKDAVQMLFKEIGIIDTSNEPVSNVSAERFANKMAALIISRDQEKFEKIHAFASAAERAARVSRKEIIEYRKQEADRIRNKKQRSSDLVKSLPIDPAFDITEITELHKQRIAEKIASHRRLDGLSKIQVIEIDAGKMYNDPEMMPNEVNCEEIDYVSLSMLMDIKNFKIKRSDNNEIYPSRTCDNDSL